MNRSARLILAGLIPALLAGCLGMPQGVEPVRPFDLESYLGRWYEIARLDHSFERGLEQVSAEYSMRPDGGVRVLNRGYDPERGLWKEAEGRAYFVEDEDVGYLKVAFFRPFYASYVVFDLDREAGRYAYVSGPDTSYLWLLSRTPTVENEVLERFRARATALGFDLSELILVDQESGKGS